MKNWIRSKLRNFLSIKPEEVFVITYCHFIISKDGLEMDDFIKTLIKNKEKLKTKARQQGIAPAERRIKCLKEYFSLLLLFSHFHLW